MNDRELMQQALDALREVNYEQTFVKLINALRERLAQPEQEPVAWRYAIDASVEGPRWIYIDKDPHQWLKGPSMSGAVIEALYATPPAAQRTWVGAAPAQPAQQEVDWKDQYEKQKRRAEMWVAKYEKDIGPIEYAAPAAAQRKWVVPCIKGITIDPVTGNVGIGTPAAPVQPEKEPVSMRMPKAGDKVICLEDDSLATVVSLTAGGSPDIVFSDGSRGTYLLREFAELFGYATPPAAQPVAWMVYTQDGQSVYVTDNPTDIQEGQRALPLYLAPPPCPTCEALARTVMLDQTSHDQFKPDYNTEAVLVEEMQRMAKRIEDLEAMLERQTARIVDLQTHIENFDGEDR